MSQISAGILGGLAVALSLGAVRLASGRDLARGVDAASSVVNRATKTDRSNIQMPRVEGRTVSVRLESLPNTSILIRIPGSYRQEARDREASQRGPGVEKAPVMHAKRTVACEPVVSVLTEIAKRLEPGRCVT
jgi:hypothetical protein